MHKKLFAVIVVFLTIMTLYPWQVNALTTDKEVQIITAKTYMLASVDEHDGTEENTSNPYQTNLELTQDEGGMFERAIAAVLNNLVAFFQGIEKRAGFQTLDVLVFNNGKSGSDLEMAPFSADDWTKLNKLYTGISFGTGGFALLVVVISAYKLMIAGTMNPQARKDAMESLWRWIGAIAIIAGAPALFYCVFQLNNGLVEAIKNVGATMGSHSNELQKLSLAEGSIIKNIITGSVIGTALVKLAFCGIEAWINIIFVMREFCLMVMYIFTPIMAWMWAINKNVMAFSIWIGELLSNAFMQSAYAFALLLFLTFNTMGDDHSWIHILIWLGILLPITEMLRNSVQGYFTRMSGFNEAGAAGGVMGALGFGSVMGLANMTSTASPVTMPSTSPGTGQSFSGGGGGSAGGGGGSGGSPLGNLGSMAGAAMAASGGADTIGAAAGLGGLGNMIGLSTSQGGGPAGYNQTNTGSSGSPQNASPGFGQTETGGKKAPGAQPFNAQQPGNNAVPGLGMVRAANTARRVGSFAEKTAGLTAGLMFAAVPGGKEFSQVIARGAAGLGATAGAMYSLGKQSKEQGGLQEVTGATSNMGAFTNALGLVANEGAAPFTGKEFANNNLNEMVPTIDGHRWR